MQQSSLLCPGQTCSFHGFQRAAQQRNSSHSPSIGIFQEYPFVKLVQNQSVVTHICATFGCQVAIYTEAINQFLTTQGNFGLILIYSSFKNYISSHISILVLLQCLIPYRFLFKKPNHSTTFYFPLKNILNKLKLQHYNYFCSPESFDIFCLYFS